MIRRAGRRSGVKDDVGERDAGAEVTRAMDRINHVKVVTPEPELVDAFLREVCDIPEGWPLSPQPSGSPRTARRSDPVARSRWTR